MKAGTAAPDIIRFVTGARFLGLSISAAQETLLRGVYGLLLVTVRSAFADRLSVEVSSRRCACFAP